MDPITYTLAPDSSTAETYYQTIRTFAGIVLDEAKRSLPIVQEYTAHRHMQIDEPPRSDGEYLFDILCLGTFWDLYGVRAMRTHALPLFVLKALYASRHIHPKLKPRIDAFRGVLGAKWLTQPVPGLPVRKTSPSIGDLYRLVLWLQATGEYKEEEKRIRLLLAFFAEIKPARYQQAITSILDFAERFEQLSEAALGEFTPNVERFRAESLPSYKGREDAVFVGRARVEYHLNMTGAEIMNRAFKQHFAESARRALLVPACMRSNPLDCKAVQAGLDMRCAGCDKECRVNRLRELGIAEGFEVHIIPHSSDFTRWLSTWAVGTGVGVIGVACPLNLIRGGLELRGLHIPAQCVLLNECGCSTHWHPEGIPTSLDEGELLRIVRSKPRYAPIPVRLNVPSFTDVLS